MAAEKQVSYTGIGAREIPEPMVRIIDKIAAYLAKKGLVLRSGAAGGSSAAFEKGCDRAGGKKNIFLPWQGFNGNNSPSFSIPERAFDIVKAMDPAWNTLAESGKKLQARYAQTILGQDLKVPSAFVICYTQGGKLKGGTGQALKIAQKYQVPVFNLGEYEHTPDMIAPKLKEFLRGTAIDADDLSL